MAETTEEIRTPIQGFHLGDRVTKNGEPAFDIVRKSRKEALSVHDVVKLLYGQEFDCLIYCTDGGTRFNVITEKPDSAESKAGPCDFRQRVS